MAPKINGSRHAGLIFGWAFMGLVFLGIQGPATADTSEQLWLDYNPSWVLSEKVTFGGDAGFRIRLDAGQGFRLVLRPGVDLPYKAVTFKAGIGNFWTITDEITNRWEIRPYQGVTWVWPRRKVVMDQYLRLEERFDFNTVTWDAVNSLRGRYRLRLRYLFGVARPDRFWRAFGSGEIFLKLAGQEGLQRDQFRLTLGLERSFNRLMRVRLQATWKQDELFLVPTQSADAIYIRLRVYQNF